MRAWLRSHPRWAVALALLALGLAALVATGRTRLYTPAYTPKIMSTLPSERRTHCVGRYLVDLPEGFYQDNGGWGDIELYYGLDKDFETVYVTVERGLFTYEQFLARVDAREKELRETINRATKEPMLLFAGRSPQQTATMFRRMDDEFYDISIKSEVHQLVGKRYVRYEQDSYDFKSPSGHKTHRNIDAGPAEERLKMIAGRLKTEAQGGEGFCFQGVIFDVGQSDEVATFDFESKTVKDLSFRVDYHAVTGQPKEGLFERLADAQLPAAVLKSLATMRHRTRLLGGMNAEEELKKTTRPVVQHIFGIETHTDKQNIARPWMALRLRTGKSVMDDTRTQEVQPEGPSSLSDEQALKLWDEIVDSVRPRPGALPAAMTWQGDTIPQCRFGDVCPRSGYWMRQVEHPSYPSNAYYAGKHQHYPMLEGMVFTPDSQIDKPELRPCTRWTWMREIDPHGASFAARREQAQRGGPA